MIRRRRRKRIHVITIIVIIITIIITIHNSVFYETTKSKSCFFSPVSRNGYSAVFTLVFIYSVQIKHGNRKWNIQACTCWHRILPYIKHSALLTNPAIIFTPHCQIESPKINKKIEEQSQTTVGISENYFKYEFVQIWKAWN